MSVENGVVISGFQKDYEVMSWNEQGEIIQVKGILTIAFLVVSPCSHIDSWKQLYCIIKIPYMVNMPTQKQLQEQIEKLESGQAITQVFAKAIINSQKQKIENFEKEITQLQEEIRKLKVKNQRLKELTGEVEGKWKLEKNMIHRFHPLTGKKQFHRIPEKFDYSKVYNPEYYYDDIDELCIKFQQLETYGGPFSVTESAYNWLKEKYFEEQKKKEMEQPLLKITNIEEMREHIEKFGFHHYNFDFFEIATMFILEYTGKTFETKYFRGKCEIKSPTTVSKHLKMFEKCKVINNIRKGHWEVTIK